jgi:hypothetical protein
VLGRGQDEEGSRQTAQTASKLAGVRADGVHWARSPACRLALVRQARPLVPSMFIAQEPQMPSRHDRRRLNVWSCSSLILSSTSSIIGPHLHVC